MGFKYTGAGSKHLGALDPNPDVMARAWERGQDAATAPNLVEGDGSFC